MRPVIPGTYPRLNLIKPEAAIPIHYDSIVDSLEYAKHFRDLCNVHVEIKHASAP